MMYYFRPGHPKASPGGFVSADDLAEIPMDPPEAKNAPIMVDRFYEGIRVPGTGEDIGTRQKHREYMRRNNLTTVDDFTNEWAQAQRQREQYRQGIMPDARARREEVARIAYELGKKNAKRRS